MMISETITYGRLSWTNIENAHADHLQGLKEKYDFHELDLEDCLSKTEQPKISEQENYVFIVFHFPLRNTKTGHFDVESLNVFVGANYLITISDGRFKKLKEQFEEMRSNTKEGKSVFKKGSGYLLYQLINEQFETCMPFLIQLTRLIHEIEEDIFEGVIAKDRLYDIMTVKRKIITLKRSILPHAPIITELEQLHQRFITKELDMYFDDIGDKITRAESQLNSLNELIENLHDANEALTSHNTNRVIKILTIFSVMMLPLTFITSLYGMNIPLPLQDNPMSFQLVTVIMFGVLIGMLVLFRWRRWI